MKVKKLIGILTAFAVAFSAVDGLNLFERRVSASNTIPASITAAQVVAAMGTGWNLGNTFDSHNGSGTPGYALTTTSITALETHWLNGAGNVTTQTLIQAVKNAGFDTIRIPVTWHKVADPANNWEIRADWMARVKEVVDWAYDLDMYVILNVHHDEYVIPLRDDTIHSADPEYADKFLKSIWEQIAETFNNDYDEKLIFEGLNEPRTIAAVLPTGHDELIEQRPDVWVYKNELTGGTSAELTKLNELNQLFVNTVRASGGNNANRILMVPTYAAGTADAALNGFVRPTDPGNTVNKIALSIHTYSPFAWAHEGQGTYNKNTITTDLTKVKARADALSIPVVLGEWGSVNGTGSSRAADRAEHAKDYITAARNLGMKAVWWDDGSAVTIQDGFGLIQRATPHTLLHPAITAAIAEAMGNTIMTASPATLPQGGGASTITVVGANLDTTTVSVRAINGDGDVIVPAEAATGDATTQTATLEFPENFGTTNITLTIQVSLDDGVTWETTPTATVVLQGAGGDSEGGGESESEGDESESEGDESEGEGSVTIYDVTFNSNYTGGLGIPHKEVADGDSLGTLPNVTRTGFTLVGWFDTADADGGTEYTATTVITKDVTLYAHWEINKYTISFNSNGGSDVPAITNAPYGSTFLPPTAPTREGYAFNGWFGAVSGGTAFTFPYTVRNNVTLHAQWIELDQFTLTYQGGGADSGTPPTDAKSPYYDGDWAVVADNTGNLIMDGYVFAGWNTDASVDDKVEYYPGELIQITANTTLYAIWVAEANEISVYGVTINGGDFSLGVGETKDLTVTFAPANATNKGVTWESDTPSVATVSGGRVTAVAEGTATIKVTSDDGGYTDTVEVTVTEAFIPVNQIIGINTETFTAGENHTLGSGMVYPSTATNKDITWSIVTGGTTAQGAEVNGVTGVVTATGGGVVVVRANIANGATATTAFTQDFTITVNAPPPVTVTVTFNYNYTGGPDNFTETLNSGESLGAMYPMFPPRRTGYRFEAWYTTSAATGGTQVSNITIIYESMTVYARWIPVGTPPTTYCGPDCKARNGGVCDDPCVPGSSFIPCGPDCKGEGLCDDPCVPGGNSGSDDPGGNGGNDDPGGNGGGGSNNPTNSGRRPGSTTTAATTSNENESVVGTDEIIVDIPVTVIQEIAGNLPTTQIAATSAGNQLITTAASNAGQNAVLMRYNAETGKFEVVSAATVNADGTATVNVPGAGDYIVVVAQTGDLTGTGTVTAADALLLLQALTGNAELNPLQAFLASSRGDSKFTATDALNILKFVAGMIDEI
ncbi:MAG: cellulase family glycosylhydrolase [Oscillospiraceae bacterium]|nr:cellulase family glycosylhydrolase [Oscillospiraceae bacterium]